MVESELEKKLNSVDKICFVEYYNLFRNYANHNITKLECVETFIVDGVDFYHNADIRCKNAKIIFQESMQEEALKLVLKSDSIDEDIKSIAREILKNSLYENVI